MSNTQDQTADGNSVLVSSRANDVRAAQQLSALIILPFGTVYVLSERNVLPLTTTNLLILAAVLLVIDAIVFTSPVLRSGGMKFLPNGSEE